MDETTELQKVEKESSGSSSRLNTELPELGEIYILPVSEYRVSCHVLGYP